MAIYHVEVYELCSTTYKVEADNAAAAIVAALTSGDLDAVGSAQQFIETDMDHGFPVAEYTGNIERINELALNDDGFIPGIRSIELVEADHEETASG